MSALQTFSSLLQSKYHFSAGCYNDLHRWCCDNPEAFWSELVAYSGIEFQGDVKPSLEGSGFSDRQFFPGVRLNYAQCLLNGVAESSGQQAAVTVIEETGQVVTIDRASLTTQVLSCAEFLKSQKVVAGDRVVAIARNSIESIVACLGCLAVGALWSSVSPELGSAAIVERFGQLKPKLLFANNRYLLNGVERRLDTVIADLLGEVPSITTVAVLCDDDFEAPLIDELSTRTKLSRWTDVLEFAPCALATLEQFAFDHPLFVMFSSGTTGVPKCIVHGAGGTLLEHIKEHRLHTDLTHGDVLLFQTSTGWMMWNWQLSALASGAHIVLYNGSVSYPEKTRLLQVLEDHQVTVFGTSPAYIQFLIESGITPKTVFDFPALRAILSTGSVLDETQFEWIVDSFKDVPVQSVSGGTDMIGCLVLGHPELPVITGDSQCISLGIDVRVKPGGTDIPDAIQCSGSGELVIVKPFPSQPVFFWGDQDGSRLRASYFEQNPGVWTHGDQIRISVDGSPQILGRSDGTLNVRGVRIGPAEILSIVNRIEGVRESLVVEQASPREPGGSRLVLLLVMRDDTPLSRPFILQLKKKIATEATRLHVPSIVAGVTDLPRTHNGKLSEKAARDSINGVEVANLAALSNPAVLLEIGQSVPEAPQ